MAKLKEFFNKIKKHSFGILIGVLLCVSALVVVHLYYDHVNSHVVLNWVITAEQRLQKLEKK